ncbi:MAG: VWA domain-containing protein [Ilumatobacteraceae bacterium]
MKPIVKLDRTLVAVEAEQQVHMMLELTAPPAPAARRAPIDVVAVIDRSGSMSGQPLEAVIAAVNLLFRLVGDDDRIAVVTFDDHVDLALPLAHHDTDTAWQALRRVRSGGSTNLSGGWLKAMEILAANGRAEALKRIVVLTDGMANLGITSHDSLSGLCSAAKAQAITTTMIGFGDGYEETLLAAMADAGGGNDYWCAGADQAAQVFGDEFTGLTSVVAQNISVEVRPADPSARFRVLNDTRSLSSTVGCRWRSATPMATSAGAWWPCSTSTRGRKLARTASLIWSSDGHPPSVRSHSTPSPCP